MKGFVISLTPLTTVLTNFHQEDSLSEENSEDNSPSAETFLPFSLPEDTFADLMFAKRLAVSGSMASSSPPLMDDGDFATRRVTTVANSEGQSLLPPKTPTPDPN